MARADVYISGDIEADGRIPGPFSMLALGLAVAGRYDGARFEPADPSADTFYAELRPISERFDPEALSVSGLDRARLAVEGEDPAAAMERAAAWIRETAGADRPVFVAYPLGWDWMFVYHYFTAFAESGSPFGHSSHLDMKTMYAVRAGATVGRSTKSQMPPQLLSSRRHTHNALDDAIEQAELFANLFRWAGPEGR
jgi:hypothetical protein